MHVYVDMYMCTWKLEDSPRCPSGATYFVFLTLDLSPAWDSPNRPGWLARRPRDPSVSSSPTVGIQVCITMPGFVYMGSGDQTQPFVPSRHAVY